MAHFLLLVLIFLGVGFYFMTAAERTRFRKVVLEGLHKAREAVTMEELQSDPFFEALRARTPRAVATPILVALSTIVCLFSGSPVFDLLISAACLLQIGLILERLVGRLAFITVYVASGIAAGLITFSASPGGMTLLASWAVLGMYGLFLVTFIWFLLHDPDATIPLNVVQRLGSVAAVFVLYKLTTTGLVNVTALAALTCGVVGGIIIARDVNERIPQIRRLATAMAIIVAVVTVYAVMTLQRPLSASMDIRPEIDRVIAVESRTTRLYEQEVDRFKKGRITAAELAVMIEKTIVPDLREVAGRLRTLRDVPPEHQSVVAAAQAFMTLRDESWKMRAAALRKSDMLALRKADSKEQASREAFHRLTMPAPTDPSREPSS